MKEPKRVLFLSQEIHPFLPEETPVRRMNKMVPKSCQENGIETRLFMPKFGEINERKNSLHDVIRLSGTNLMLRETDHPLLLKVASIPSARVQVYFVDSDDYFLRRKGIADEQGVEYADNDERTIFFARAALETIKKLCWTPNIIQCSGWMAAMAPLYVNKVYRSMPFFEHAKIVVALSDGDYKRPFGTDFADKLVNGDIKREDVTSLEGHEISYVELMKFAIDHADAVIIITEGADPELIDYAKQTGKLLSEEVMQKGEDVVAYYQQMM